MALPAKPKENTYGFFVVSGILAIAFGTLFAVIGAAVLQDTLPIMRNHVYSFGNVASFAALGANLPILVFGIGMGGYKYYREKDGRPLSEDEEMGLFFLHFILSSLLSVASGMIRWGVTDGASMALAFASTSVGIGIVYGAAFALMFMRLGYVKLKETWQKIAEAQNEIPLEMHDHDIRHEIRSPYSTAYMSDVVSAVSSARSMNTSTSTRGNNSQQQSQQQRVVV